MGNEKVTGEHNRPQISEQQKAVEEDLVQRVLDSFETTEDPRLKFIMQRLTVHLHDFIRDVRLTEDEWDFAINFLTQVGHITDDKRQEFVLLSDTLGASMQTIAVNNEAYEMRRKRRYSGRFTLRMPPRLKTVRIFPSALKESLHGWKAP